MSTRVTSRQLRSFGLTVGGVFGCIGLWPLAVHRAEPRLWALVLAAVLALPALVLPRILLPAYKGWMGMGRVLGWVNTRIILGAIFYLLLTPMGLLRRLSGKGEISKHFDPRAKSYRIPKQLRPPGHMDLQY